MGREFESLWGHHRFQRLSWNTLGLLFFWVPNGCQKFFNYFRTGVTLITKFILAKFWDRCDPFTGRGPKNFMPYILVLHFIIGANSFYDWSGIRLRSWCQHLRCKKYFSLSQCFLGKFLSKTLYYCNLWDALISQFYIKVVCYALYFEKRWIIEAKICAQLRFW